MNKITTLLTALLLSFLCSTMAMGQNKIDKMVEKFSTVGSATFTSVVERNPDTRQVQKVVKVLKVRGDHANSLKQAFEEEKDKGTFSEKKEAGEHTLSLSCESDRQVRLYLLQLTGHSSYHDAQCTIIIKMK